MNDLTIEIFEMRDKIPSLDDITSLGGVVGVCEVLRDCFAKEDPEAKAGVVNRQLVEQFDDIIRGFDYAFRLALYVNLLEEEIGIRPSYDFESWLEEYEPEEYEEPDHCPCGRCDCDECFSDENE